MLELIDLFDRDPYIFGSIFSEGRGSEMTVSQMYRRFLPPTEDPPETECATVFHGTPARA